MSAIQGSLTRQGRQMFNRAQAGEKLEFTRFSLGDGFLEPNETLQEMTSLKHELFSVRVYSAVPCKVNDVANLDNIDFSNGAETNAILIHSVFTNQKYPQGFDYRELALWARIGDEIEEKVYAYGNAYDRAEPIPPAFTSTAIEKRIRWVVAIGTAANVTAMLEVTLGVSHEEFEQDQARQDADIAALRNRTSILGDDIMVLYDLLFNDITSNAFLVTFDTLDGVEVEGVWNQAQQRIEF